MKSTSGLIQKIVIFLVIIFVCYVNYLTITQSRNVFFMDDWVTPGSIFYSHLNGDLDFDDLFSQHNESRPILSLIYSLLLLEVANNSKHSFSFRNLLKKTYGI